MEKKKLIIIGLSLMLILAAVAAVAEVNYIYPYGYGVNQELSEGNSNKFYAYNPTGTSSITIQSGTGYARINLIPGTGYSARIYYYNSSGDARFRSMTNENDIYYIMNASGNSITQAYQNGDLWVRGDIEGNSYSDHTSAPKESKDVIKELKDIVFDDCGKEVCEVNHDTLPDEMQGSREVVVLENDEPVTYEETTRDISYAVSWLMLVIQKQQAQIEELEARVAALEKK